ncbi:hypothetical protein QBC38DRAFT_485067 [Podospora fimiseda]|uniref:Uncharacterized protein n=1 Tax=Podospora fimiseda TaxID=252190 RepID=A0AAN7BK08_9PEZI|nr:hypothetical protein QBC38DRAFT_485067 [Podospora fimiseda]
MKTTMRSAIILTALVAVTHAQLTLAPSIPTVSGCPAVLSVTALCSTCMTLACIETATISAGCDGCPSAPATIFTGYPCENNCEGLGGCKTEYLVVSAADPGECSGPAATQTTLSGTVTESSSLSSSAGPVSTNAAARLRPFRLW